MKKQDELDLWNEMFANASRFEVVHLEPAYTKLGMNYKRAEYLVNKWANKGLIEYGTSCQYCWKI